MNRFRQPFSQLLVDEIFPIVIFCQGTLIFIKVLCGRDFFLPQQLIQMKRGHFYIYNRYLRSLFRRLDAKAK